MYKFLLFIYLFIYYCYFVESLLSIIAAPPKPPAAHIESSANLFLDLLNSFMAAIVTRPPVAAKGCLFFICIYQKREGKGREGKGREGMKITQWRWSFRSD